MPRTLLAILGSLLWAPAILMAWPGYEYEHWRQVTTWTRPEKATDQAGKSELVPLLAVAGSDEPARQIDEIRAWEARRAEVAATVGRFLGEPVALQVPAVEVELLDKETLDDHIRRHIRIRSESDDWIPAYLLIPRNLLDKPLPAMICVHQTVARGKDEPCGISGSEDLALARQLVQRGYICIAPDMIGFGERISSGTQPYHDSMSFYRRHPGWSFMGKMVWDISRVIDYLETLSEVDPLQIGCIGHSHGAYTSVFAAALEPRVSLVIASCGFNTFREDPQPHRWSHLTPLIPQLGIYLPDVAAIPFDWHQVFALIAPRPMFIWYATEDTIFPDTDGLDAVFKDVRGVYGLYGAADDFDWHAYAGPHSFTREGRKLAWHWLSERFFCTAGLRHAPRDLKEWERQRERIRRVIRRTIGPPAEKPASPDIKILEKDDFKTHERRLIEYAVQEGERIRAYLCVPKREGRLPAVLVLHQTVAQGKRESVGLEGAPTLAFGRDLAERGYVTLSPDSVAVGERIDRFGAFDTRGHYLRHPDRSVMGRMLDDAMRAVDVLVRMDEVDPRRIGAIGHSLGAEEALFLGAFDERVVAVVATCGYATFKAEKDRLRWARDHWFSYMPKLRPVFQRGRLPAWDWDDVLRLIAPRPLFQYIAAEDDIFTESRSAHVAGESARVIWNLYGHPDRLANMLGPGKHAVPESLTVEMYHWLDKQLMTASR